jgi:hypothetical protein
LGRESEGSVANDRWQTLPASKAEESRE